MTRTVFSAGMALRCKGQRRTYKQDTETDEGGFEGQKSQQMATATAKTVFFAFGGKMEESYMGEGKK